MKKGKKRLEFDDDDIKEFTYLYKDVTDEWERSIEFERSEDYEEEVLRRMNEKNNTDFKTFQEMSNAGHISVCQISIEAEKDGVPIGKLVNQAHYWIANDNEKKARKLLKLCGLSSSQVKEYVEDEVRLQYRNPKEVEKYKNKPLPEELKLPEGFGVTH